jgi:hypothetical protein
MALAASNLGQVVTTRFTALEKLPFSSSVLQAQATFSCKFRLVSHLACSASSIFSRIPCARYATAPRHTKHIHSVFFQIPYSAFFGGTVVK